MIASPRSRGRCLWAVLAVVALSAPASAQCICTQTASVSKLPAMCAGAAALNATPPVVGALMTIYVTGAPAEAPIFLGASVPPAVPGTTPGGCLVHLDFGTLMVHGPFVTNGGGAWTLDWVSPNDPSLCGLTCNLQAAIAGTGGADPGFVITNGIQATMGCPDGGAPNGLPSGAFCSYTQGGFHNTGTPGQLYNANFLSTFPSGVEAGHYDTASGNAAPNGLRWEGTAAGRLALKTFLPGGGPSGVVASDQLNPLTSFSGGALAYQTVTVALNKGFNDAGVFAGGGAAWSGLVYINAGSPLSGLTISQILPLAHDALSGLGLPSGISFGSLVSLMTSFNESFDDCHMSSWAADHLFLP